MKPWFAKEADIIKFPEPEKKVVELPNVQSYPDFLTGVKDLHNRKEKGEISQDSHDKLYQDLIHRFMKKEDPETPWFIAEQIADKKQYAEVVKQLASLGIQFNKQPLNVKPGRPMNMRATGSTQQEVQDALKKIDPSIKVMPTNTPITSSRTYDQAMFKYQGKDYYLITRALVTTKTGTVVKKFGRKELTPKGLGMNPVYQGLDALAKDIQNKINSKYQSPIKEMLIGVLKNAVNSGSQQSLDENSLEVLNDSNNYKSVNQDFGETVAPLLLGEKSDTVEFPVGNEPLVDVRLPGRDIAIKALTGSGNAFTKIKDLFDEYEKTINKKDKKKNAKFQILSIFANANLSSINSIIVGAHTIKSPEMAELTRMTGKMKITNQDELSNALQKLIIRKGKSLPYDKFLDLVRKIGGASKTKVFGVPKGGSQTGERTYNADPLKYATLTITYALGKGVENVINNGVEKEAYGEILQNIMKQVKAEVGVVGINKQGIWSVATKPFSALNFKFDYHAYTSNPGNNRPGFAIVRPK
jgi:hypothetical protein